MLNIKTVSYKIMFLEDITFKEEPEIAFFKTIYRRLKNILCINSKEVCSDCMHSSKCLYNYMSAGDFEYMENMPIIIDKPLFSKRTVKAKDILNLEFTFLGDAAIHMDFINYILMEFESRGLFKERYRFIIEDRREISAKKTQNGNMISTIEVVTPIDSTKDIFEFEEEKVNKLNELYNITDESLYSITEPYNFKAIKFNIKNPLHIGSRKIIRKGYVGTIKFKKPIPYNNLLKIIEIIGAGKFYGIGGGYIEVYKCE